MGRHKFFKILMFCFKVQMQWQIVVFPEVADSHFTLRRYCPIPRLNNSSLSVMCSASGNGSSWKQGASSACNWNYPASALPWHEHRLFGKPEKSLRSISHFITWNTKGNQKPRLIKMILCLFIKGILEHNCFFLPGKWQVASASRVCTHPDLL